MSEEKGVSIYLPSAHVRDILRSLAAYHRRSMGQQAEKLILDEWYRLPQEVRAEIEWEQFHEGDPGGHG